MPTKEETTPNLKKCPRFDRCSINVCPMDLEANLRNKLPGEDCCPFTIKKKRKSQKGIRTHLPDHILRFIPESNVKMLNKGNQNRWHSLCKKDETR